MPAPVNLHRDRAMSNATIASQWCWSVFLLQVTMFIYYYPFLCTDIYVYNFHTEPLWTTLSEWYWYHTQSLFVSESILYRLLLPYMYFSISSFAPVFQVRALCIHAVPPWQGCIFPYAVALGVHCILYQLYHGSIHIISWLYYMLLQHG